MEIDEDTDLQQALTLSMQVPKCKIQMHTLMIHCACGRNEPISAHLTQAALTVQVDEAQDEPAPPPDTEMLTHDPVPHANPSTGAANDHAQQQEPQAQQPSAAPNSSIQSNFFAAALAQAIAALPQQEGEC